jgi:hypothetical protein
MKPAGIESWIVGAVTPVLIAAFHWLAFRVGRRRQLPRLVDPDGIFGRRHISNSPIEPR